MGGRVYDPLAARFTTADPIIQAPFWSQGLNRYAYVFNDPINATDPSGFMTSGSNTAGDTVGATALAIGWGTVAYGFATASGFSFPALSGTGIIGAAAGGGSGALSGYAGAAKPAGGS